MKKLINWIREKIEQAYGGIIYLLIVKGEDAIKITNVIKKIVNSKAVNAYALYTKTLLDDKLIAFGKDYTPIVIQKLGIAMAIVNKEDTLEDSFNKVVKFMQGLPKDGTSILYRELSAMIMEAKNEDSPNGTKISKGEIVAIIQLIYKGIFKK